MATLPRCAAAQRHNATFAAQWEILTLSRRLIPRPRSAPFSPAPAARLWLTAGVEVDL